MGRSTPNFKSFSYHHAPYGKSRIFLVCPIFRHPKKICKHNQRNPANNPYFLEGNIGHAYAIEEFSSKQWIQQILKGC